MADRQILAVAPDPSVRGRGRCRRVRRSGHRPCVIWASLCRPRTTRLRVFPAKGPVIVVANHPHGLVDGMVLAELVGRVRHDYKILTRSLLTEVEEIKHFMIPVPFPHEEGAIEKSLEMRKRAMAHLEQGGRSWSFSRQESSRRRTRCSANVVEREWNPFTAKMIQRSDATGGADLLPGSKLATLPDRQPTFGDAASGAADPRSRRCPEQAAAPDRRESRSTAMRLTVERQSARFHGWLREETLKLKP